VILDVPGSHRRVLARASELVGGVEYQLIENGEVVLSGGGRRKNGDRGAGQDARAQ
jgi:hypothetical protein